MVLDLSVEEELALVSRAKEGDSWAFDRLVVQYQTRFYNLAYRMLGHRADAQEVTQEAFFQMYKNLRRFEARARFSTWATRIVINLCLNLRKKKWRRKTDYQVSLDDQGPDGQRRKLSEILAATGPGPAEKLRGREIAEALQAGLDRLSEMHRKILVLRDIQGHTYQEIAEVLKLSEGTVKSRLSRARNNLKSHVKKWL